jgi:hypothetical protein
VQRRILFVGSYRSVLKEAAAKVLLNNAVVLSAGEPHASMITAAEREDCAVMVFPSDRFASMFFRLPPKYATAWSPADNYAGVHLFKGRKRLMVILKNPCDADDGIVRDLMVRVAEFMKGV